MVGSERQGWLSRRTGTHSWPFQNPALQYPQCAVAEYHSPTKGLWKEDGDKIGHTVDLILRCQVFEKEPHTSSIVSLQCSLYHGRCPSDSINVDEKIQTLILHSIQHMCMKGLVIPEVFINHSVFFCFPQGPRGLDGPTGEKGSNGLMVSTRSKG